MICYRNGRWSKRDSDRWVWKSGGSIRI
ncbi:hypothetical protein ACFORI_03385 [Niastella sp. GCM10012298]